MKILPIEPPDTRLSNDPTSKIARGYGKHVGKLSYSRKELSISVQNMLRVHQAEVDRSKSMVGRIVYLFIQPPDPDFIEIDGNRLILLMEYAEEPIPEGLLRSKNYNVDIPSLKKTLLKVQDGVNT